MLMKEPLSADEQDYQESLELNSLVNEIHQKFRLVLGRALLPSALKLCLLCLLKEGVAFFFEHAADDRAVSIIKNRRIDNLLGAHVNLTKAALLQKRNRAAVNNQRHLRPNNGRLTHGARFAGRVQTNILPIKVCAGIRAVIKRRHLAVPNWIFVGFHPSLSDHLSTFCVDDH